MRKRCLDQQSSQSGAGWGGVSFISTSAPGRTTTARDPRCGHRTSYRDRRSGPPALTRHRAKQPLPSARRIEETTPRRGLFRYVRFVRCGGLDVEPIADCRLPIADCRLPSWLLAWFRPAGRVTFSKRGKSDQKRFAPASGPALRSGCVHYAAAPRVAVQGPSMALYGSRRIPAARPSARRLRSPS